MADHFQKVLGETKPKEEQPFIPSSSWLGSKKNYFFSTGSLGTGYYLDGSSKKRKSREEDEDWSDGVRQKKIAPQSMDAEALLEAAEAQVGDDVVDFDLDESGLKVLVLGFEKKINKNQRMRVKYVDEPDKFVESECELDEEIKKLFAVSASPELYPSFVQLGAVASLMGLLAHDNTDVCLAVIALLVELTDTETGEEASEEMGVLVDALIQHQGLELLVQNLGRLDESNSEDADGVYSTLNVFENLIEFRPSISVTLCTNTNILKFLLKRLKSKKFDPNKLYASELLSIILQDNAAKLGDVGGTDGVDELLQAASYYRKRDPTSEEEEELVENMFDCLSAALTVADNQVKFRHSQGFELMVRCMKEKNHAGSCALKVLDYAVANSSANCEALVHAGGLKVLFPAFMGRGVVRSAGKKKKSVGGKKKVVADSEAEALAESHAISVVGNLCLQLQCGNAKSADMLPRLVAKFCEDNNVKVDRLVELYAEFCDKVRTFDMNPGALDVDSDEEEEVIAEIKYDRRLSAGLFSLHMLAVVIATIAIYSSAARERCRVKLFEKNIAGVEVKKMLINCAARYQRIVDGAVDEVGEEGEEVDSTANEKRLVELIARLAVSFPLVEVNSKVGEAAQAE